MRSARHGELPAPGWRQAKRVQERLEQLEIRGVLGSRLYVMYVVQQSKSALKNLRSYSVGAIAIKPVYLPFLASNFGFPISPLRAEHSRK